MTAVEFLEEFHPDRFWVLTAIKAHQKGIKTVTFTPDQSEQATKWIAAQNEKANIYFSVNQPSRPLTKKATRDDITSVEWLHVDMDARKDEPLEEALPRIRGVLDNCPVQRPTVVIFSGGGYQAFWRLAQPIPVRTTAAKLDVALYNKQLEAVLEGDNCHNIDRIMRLPGTMNIPDSKKIERGRIQAMAEVTWFGDEQYDITDFTPAPDVQMDGMSHGGALTVPTGNVDRLDSVDDLKKWNVPERVKIIIVQGEHPDEVKPGDSSRSEWLFDAVCNLVRSEVPDEVIYSIITDPGFLISASVTDKKPNEDEYAIRQIERAKDLVISPELYEMNKLHCIVLDYGGKTRIITEKYCNVFKRRASSVQKKSDFMSRYAGKTITEGKKQIKQGEWWFNHRRRRVVESLVYLPGEDAPGDLNLWQGFNVDPRKGDGHKRYLNHIYENLCCGNDEHFKYLIGWLARAVQKPARLGEVAIVLRGGRGTGKSFFAKRFGNLWGSHFLQVSSTKHLVGHFNAHLRDCSVLFADEAFWAGDKKHGGTLKALVTEETMLLEGKGVDSVPARNLIHLIMASNEDWVVPAGAQERRFFVLDVGDKCQQDHRYFTQIAADLESAGYNHLLYFLLNYDLTGFEVRSVPRTAALSDQIQHKLSLAEQQVMKALETGYVPGSATVQAEGRVMVAASDFVPMENLNINTLNLAKSVGHVIKKIRDDDPSKRRPSDRQLCYWLPALSEARVRWEKVFGFKLDYDKEVVTWTPSPF